MPVYEYKCERCQAQQEAVHGVGETPAVACACGQVMQRQTVNALRVNYKGWDWVTKNQREDEYRQRRSARMQKKMLERPTDKLVPNVNGEILDNWTDAQKYAQEKGYASASYETQVRKERKKHGR
jgi:putative FmdB family regulatory protein